MDLELKESLYAANQRIPTWPIDFRLVAKFTSSQLVPPLGLTGLSDAAASGGLY